MLKVLKSKQKIVDFKDEFAYIIHGDYVGFIDKINSGLPPHENNIHFELLLKAAPSFKIFYKKCKLFYGEIQDSDLTDPLF